MALPSPTMVLQPKHDLPIVLHQGTHFTHNPSSHYCTLSYHTLPHPLHLSHFHFFCLFLKLQVCLSSLWLEKSHARLLLSVGNLVVGCQRVITIKVGLNGTIDRLKACILAKGYTQIFGYS